MNYPTKQIRSNTQCHTQAALLSLLKPIMSLSAPSICLALMVGCSTSPHTPTLSQSPSNNPSKTPSSPSNALKGLGGLELSFSGINSAESGTVTASLKPFSSVLGPQVLTTATGLSATSVSQGTFRLNGVRYLSATFKITPNSSLNNLTFMAEVKSPNTINETAILKLNKFDGSPASPVLARTIKPLHGMDLQGELQDQVSVRSTRADFQAFDEIDLTGYAPADGGYLLPWGFVAKTVSGTRLLTSSDPGYVTFSFQMPSSGNGTTDPYSVSVFLQAVTDPTTRVTETQAEQPNPFDVQSRAASANASTIYTLAESLLPSDILAAPQIQRLCKVRTAGTALNPLEQLFPLGIKSTVINPISPILHAQNVARANPSIVANFVQDYSTLASPAVLHSSFQNHQDAIVTTGTNSTTLTPARAYLPGELLEVSFPSDTDDAECGVGSYVYRFRASSDPTNGLNATAVSYPVGTAPQSIEAGDLNGDGRLDLVTANTNGNSISVLLQQGDGTFSTTNYLIGANPTTIALGDINNDGKLDVVSSNLSSNNVSILLQQTDGSFGVSSAVLSVFTPTSIAIGDLNGDGKLDLVSTSGQLGNISVFLQQANNTFNVSSDYPVGIAPIATAIGDLNGDGRLDIIVANSGSNSVSVLLQNANGKFKDQIEYAVGLYPTSVSVGDLSNDGKLDIVSANSTSNNVSVLLQQVGGSYSTTTYSVGNSPYSVVVGDLSGDGKLDIVSANRTDDTTSVLTQQANGNFAANTYTVGDNPYSVVLGDLNSDGNLDLASVNSANTPLGNSVSILSSILVP
jgi:hypothetical protein